MTIRPVFLLAALLLTWPTLMPAAESDGTISLTGPRGGWRHGALMEDSESAKVAAYPKPPVDRGGQRYRTLIEGQLRAVGKGREPGRYIVNGIAKDKA